VTSIGEVKLALEQSCESLRDAYRCVREAQGALDEAVGLLDKASADHHQPLVPPEFTKAGEMFADELELIVTSLELARRLTVEL
jgi:exonuclease VII small subunit